MSIGGFGQTRLEWALLGVIAVVCGGLSLLQYRWTGELSQAERMRLRAGLDEQARRLTRAFDDEIRESCLMLLPDAAEVQEKGREEAHRIRYHRWSASHEEALFARIGVAVPEQETLRLYGLDRGGLVAMEWPPAWEPLRTAMTARMRGLGPPPTAPVNSNLMEMPMFARPGERRESGPEVEWMIFELSEDHLRKKVLPDLVSEYLNPAGEDTYDVSVSGSQARGRLIYSTRQDQASVARGADLTAGIFPLDMAPPGGRRRRSRDEGSRTRWTVAVRHREGSLDAVVTRARNRNFVTSVLLLGVLAGAAWALVRYTARSRRLAHMQFRFAAGVSHDLRTPLTAIRGAAYNLAHGVVTEPAARDRYANLILRNAEELTAMIENVLAFSASLHSTRTERHETVAVGELLEHAASATAQELEAAGCRMELTVAPGLPSLQGDAVALEHAFRNLIANAARHAAQGRWVGVAAAPSSDGVEVRVCDRGPGIPETEQKSIFEPFYRGTRPETTFVRGTGLGLSLVKDTIERHGGTIEVRNSPAGGAQFTVRLPAVPELA